MAKKMAGKGKSPVPLKPGFYLSFDGFRSPDIYTEPCPWAQEHTMSGGGIKS